jgi:hypothetical protein
MLGVGFQRSERLNAVSVWRISCWISPCCCNILCLGNHVVFEHPSKPRPFTARLSVSSIFREYFGHLPHNAEGSRPAVRCVQISEEADDFWPPQVLLQSISTMSHHLCIHSWSLLLCLLCVRGGGVWHRWRATSRHGCFASHGRQIFVQIFECK